MKSTYSSIARDNQRYAGRSKQFFASGTKCVCFTLDLQSIDHLLGHAKTEVLWCTSSRRQHQIPSGPVRIGTTYVQPVSSTRDLGVYIDADMSMRTHATAVVRAFFEALRQIRSVRRSLSRHALLTLVCALIVSKVDYCNSVLAGIPASCKTGCSPY